MKRLIALSSAFLITVATMAGGFNGAVASAAAGPNLITNPGMETAAGATPTGWSSDQWGTNAAAFSYASTGHSGSRSLAVKVTGYQTGDAKWYFSPVAVKPGATYTFSNWYKGSAASGVDAVITTTTGPIAYKWIADVPPSSAWKHQSYSFKAPANAKNVTFYHYLSSNGSLDVDDYSLTANDSTTPVPTPQPTPPTVSLTAPAANATVSAAQTVSATASDAKAVASVQFKLDGVNLGTADTTAPYSTSWDTTKFVNGNHTLTAVATNVSKLTATSTSVVVTVSNSTTPPPTTPPTAGNLITNASVETANGTAPANWIADGWGTNTRNLTYENTGQDGSRSVKTAITSYTNGDAKWYFNPVAATANTTYNYSEWYKSNVDSEVDAMVTMNDGSLQYFWLGNEAASAGSYQKLTMQFTAPANTKNVTIFHVLSKVGYVQSDNFSLTANASGPATQLTRGLVSLTFDDGWRSIHTNGLPVLTKYGLTSTQYLNSEPIVGGYPDYMTYQMVKDFKAGGHELAWHTRSHADITKLTAANLTTELTIPQDFLTGTGTAVTDYKNFASPYGAYNAASVATVMGKYQSHRSTDVGYNSKVGFDVTNIKVQNITNTTTPADVQAWVNQALANKTWLVIVYHEVSTNAADPTYAVTPANFDSELNLIKQSGITVKSMDAAIAEVNSQL